MPFTPTHVLAVLPIAAVSRRMLPFSALVIGSMVPDFPLFSPLSPSYDTTHSVPGLLTACLPIGLVGVFVFQSLMKRPLLALTPEAIQRRCVSLSVPCLAPTPKAFLRASLAVVIGAATHLLWDTFTHRGRWGTRHFPGLNETALTIRGYAVPGFKVLQYGSTFVGLPCLVLLLAVWLKRRAPESLGGRPVLSTSAKITAYLVAVTIPASVASLLWLRGDLSPYHWLGRSITVSGLILTVSTLAYCLVFFAFEGRMRRAT